MKMPERLSREAYAAALGSLRNPHGDRICRQENITYFYQHGANLQDLLTLFKGKTPDNYERFFADAIKTFMEHGGYSTHDLVEIAELKDHKGDFILASSNEFYDFTQAKGKIGDAKALASVKDSEGCTIYRHDERWDLGFEGFKEIGRAVKKGITAEMLQELVDIRNDDGVSVFRSPRDINRFLGSGGDIGYANSLLALRDHEHRQIFNEYAIGVFKEKNIQVEEIANLVSLKDTDNQVIFSNAEDAVDYIYHFMRYGRRRSDLENGLTLVEQVCSLRDSHNQSIFRDGREVITSLQATNNNISQIQEFCDAKDETGENYFTGEDIALLLQHHVPLLYATTLAKKQLNAMTIMYHYRLGLSENETEFTNSGKPKALILYPTDNPRHLLLQAFTDEKTFEFLKKFYSEYDVKIRAISQVDELFEELDKAQDTYLTTWGGHGSPTTVCFGTSNPKYNRYIPETSARLTPAHMELQEHLKLMKNLEYILLDSCLTGEGREGQVNMVNFVADSAPTGVIVTGPTDPTNGGLTKIDQVYPPEIRMLSTKDYQDCTYTRRSR